MGAFEIRGGNTLSGIITPQGAKKRGIAGTMRSTAYRRASYVYQRTGYTGCKHADRGTGRYGCKSIAPGSQYRCVAGY